MTPYFQDDAAGIVIYHGRAEDVLPTLEAASTDLVFCDPPYGHNNNNNGDLIQRREAALGHGPAGEARAIANDGAGANDLVRFAFGEFARILKPGCCCCCCGGGGGPDPQFARWALWLDEAVGFKQMVIWDKGPMGMGWHYRRSYETVLVGEKPGAACHWFDTTNRVENIIRHLPRIIPTAKDHPTPKPVALAAHFIRLHSQPGDLVVDPFMGGGSTLEAARLLSRRFLGVEVSEEYCRVSVERLRQGVLPW